MNHPKRMCLFMLFSLFLLFLTMFNVSALSPVVSAKVADGAIVAQDVQTGEVVIKDNNGNSYMAKMLGGNIVSKSEIKSNQIIVKYKKMQNNLQISEAITKITGKFAAQMNSLDETLRLKLIKIPNEADYLKIMAELKLSPDIEYAEPDYICRESLTPNDPYYSIQWGPPYIKANEAWDKVSVAQRSDIIIAIIDTGIALNHPDLVSSIIGGYDFINNDGDPSDDRGHGTHVAGIAAAIVNNQVGIAGIAGGAKLMPVKVLGSDGRGPTSVVVQGMRYAADNGAKVLNMSLGGPGTSDAVQDAVNYAMSKGAVVVAASGNDNGPVSYPGNCNGVITVGSIDSNGARYSSSNYGPTLDVVAPGADIFSCIPGGYGYKTGTSMATPAVAGIAALLFAVNSSFTLADITQIIQGSATDAGAAGFDNYYGYGIVNASKAVDLAIGGIPTPTPTQRAVTPTPRRRISGAYSVNYVTTSDWGSGSIVTVTINNNTAKPVNGWTLNWTFPGKHSIAKLWDGQYTQKGAKVSVKNGSKNAIIPPGGTVSFEFYSKYRGFNAKPRTFTLNMGYSL